MNLRRKHLGTRRFQIKTMQMVQKVRGYFWFVAWWAVVSQSSANWWNSRALEAQQRGGPPAVSHEKTLARTSEVWPIFLAKKVHQQHIRGREPRPRSARSLGQQVRHVRNCNSTRTPPPKRIIFDMLVQYRQPGLLCTPRNFAQSSKLLGKQYFLLLRLPLRNFQAFPKIWRSHVFRVAHKRNFNLVDETLIFQGHLNVLWGSFMALLCSSRWSD